MWIAEKPVVLSGRQDAALYGSQDGRRYAKHVPPSDGERAADLSAEGLAKVEGRVRGELMVPMHAQNLGKATRRTQIQSRRC
ncbi:MAG: hypothetical protein DME19_03435, partial [Verrucomicrobia bacterium]